MDWSAPNRNYTQEGGLYDECDVIKVWQYENFHKIYFIFSLTHIFLTNIFREYKQIRYFIHKTLFIVGSHGGFDFAKSGICGKLVSNQVGLSSKIVVWNTKKSSLFVTSTLGQTLYSICQSRTNTFLFTDDTLEMFK